MISHGHEVKSFDDPYVDLTNKVMSYVDKVITPNKFWVDLLPFREYLIFVRDISD